MNRSTRSECDAFTNGPGPLAPDELDTLVVGMGCFWGADRLFWQMTGVYTTAVGYAGGTTPTAQAAYDIAQGLSDLKSQAEGLLSNFSWHAGSLKLKVFGGQTRKILFRESGAEVTHLENHSWMPPASAMGLTDQDVRDVAEYLKRLTTGG